jgi:hypothetical protein
MDASVLPGSRGTVGVVAGHQVLYTTIDQARKFLGTPTSTRPAPGNSQRCNVRWRRQGLEGVFSTELGVVHVACSAPAQAFLSSFRATGGSWHTRNGLRVGDSLTQLRALYPNASQGGSDYTLASEFYVGTESYIPVLAAEVRRGVVRALIVDGGPNE